MSNWELVDWSGESPLVIKINKVLCQDSPDQNLDVCLLL